MLFEHPFFFICNAKKGGENFTLYDFFINADVSIFNPVASGSQPFEVRGTLSRVRIMPNQTRFLVKINRILGLCFTFLVFDIKTKKYS